MYLNRFWLTGQKRRFIVLLMPEKNGFTLIELLVVITIITIMALFSVNLYTGAQERSRDAKRQFEVNQVFKALQLYYKDHEQAPDTINFGRDWLPYFLIVPQDPRAGALACSGNVCGYYYAKSATCQSGTSCVGYGKPAVWTFLERCEKDSDTGDSSVLGQGCPFFMKILPY